MTLLFPAPAEARNIFEVLFGPPSKSHAIRRAHSVRRVVRPALPRHKLAAKPVRHRIARAHTAKSVVDPAKNGTVQRKVQALRLISDTDHVANIMSDPSLRAGDIVVFPDGPRVYKGSGRFSSHRISDFKEPAAADLPVTIGAVSASASYRFPDGRP